MPKSDMVIFYTIIINRLTFPINLFDSLNFYNKALKCRFFFLLFLSLGL